MADQAERAARLAKADLVTGMVGEFPELQGLMGGYYAAAQGEAPAVAEAIRDHYKPVGQGDEVPTAPVTVAVSLADKIDTISNFFAIDEAPSGSRDPFALRRAALGVIKTIRGQHLRMDLIPVVLEAAGQGIISRQLAPKAEATSAAISAIGKALDFRHGPKVLDVLSEALQQTREAERDNPISLLKVVETVAAVRDFFLDRIEVACRDEGVRADIIRAAVIIDGDKGKESDLVRLLARVHALQSFVTTEDGANLLAGYKRAANILKKEDYVAPAKAGAAGLSGEDGSSIAAAPASAGATLSYTPEPAEADLIAALDAAGPAAADAVANEDFEAAMAALATLRAPIDAFFDAVTVNDADPAKRAARLALLARVRDAVHGVADFSKIEG